MIAYGESKLGCRAISTIWMSYYVDGCGQELHCDNPHGPFAFVLSLTGRCAGMRNLRQGRTEYHFCVEGRLIIHSYVRWSIKDFQFSVSDGDGIWLSCKL